MAALEREIKPLVRDWRTNDRECNGKRFRFFESGERVAVCGGIGPEAARRAAEAIISMYQPATIYSVGFAGALASDLKVGDIVFPSRVINASDGSSVETSGGEGVLVSFASVAGPEQKAKLRESFSADAVDMEAAFVARAADARAVDFVAIKAISDELGFALPPMDRFVDREGRLSERRFGFYAALRPWLWRQVMRMARNSRIAARSLCERLANLDAAPVASSTIQSKGVGDR